jgi:orotidine-5'-phosphate decarboxylase
MDETFGDRLLAAIAAKKAPICVGIDPMFNSLPEAIVGSQRSGEDAETAIDAIYEFTIGVLNIVAPHVPVVKFQSAYFEQYHWEGVQAYFDLIHEAKELGLLVIGDIKRGDIGSTVTAYAAGHLADPPAGLNDDLATPDAVTVNPMLGLDTLEPFLQTAKTYNKGLFVLVRTSNPGSADLQDVKLEDGRTWSEALADKLAPLAADKALVGLRGYSSVGAVVGATQAHTMASLRNRLPQSIFLLPGYGTQGATGEMTKAAFVDGRGAIVSASRSILYAHREKKYADLGDWKKCVERAVVDMKQDIARFV